MTALHATEPATVYLSCWARVEGLKVADVERSLFTDRSLVKQLAMRRTLFAFPRDLLAAVWPSASARVAATERAQMVKEVVKAGLADDGDAWLDLARAEVLATLADAPEGRTALQIRQAVPMVDVKVSGADGALWSAPRVLTHLGSTADVMRGHNTSHWRTSTPRWILTRHWLGDVASSWDAADGYREIVRRWLHSFGPGTEDDLVWWLGSTKTVVRAALAELDAVPVSLDDRSHGWLLPDDTDVTDPGPWVALLPVLDPTVMGWKERTFYLGPHRDQLFDSRGNAGTTAWVDGRVVGCWVQDHAGDVEVRLLERVSAQARRHLQAEASRLTTWLHHARVGTSYVSPAMNSELATKSMQTPY